jgi:hypothetical protein
MFSSLSQLFNLEPSSMPKLHVLGHSPSSPLASAAVWVFRARLAALPALTATAATACRAAKEVEESFGSWRAGFGGQVAKRLGSWLLCFID